LGQDPSPTPSLTGLRAGGVAVKRSIIKALPKDLRDWAEAVERALSQVRAWVEHPFHIVKNLFRHR
jgi:IS5 family transposase